MIRDRVREGRMSDSATAETVTLEDVLASLESVARYARVHELEGLDEVLVEIIGQLLATGSRTGATSDARARVFSQYDA